MNPFKAIDKFIGQKLYPVRVRLDVKSYLTAGVVVPEAIAKLIYDNSARKLWKPYGITLKDIQRVVNDACEVKPLHGIKLWIALRKASLTIQNAIKQKRIVFLDENKVEYTDKGFFKYKVNFDELADIFINKTQQGFNKEHIINILEKEYKRSRK